ncbi:MAG TPA: RES family NAD+ phosphorylase [Phycisphaerae bacterium]|nr:RES family NAD+ phosphorylase [Phycisphaerae bacterium]
MWYRAFHPSFLSTPLATSHTALAASRYNEGATALPQFEVLYLAEDHQVALLEVGAILGSPLSLSGQPPFLISNPASPWSILPIRVQLQSIADITRTSQLALLRTTAQEITGDWRANYARQPFDSVSQPVGTAPTQELGQALSSFPDLEGFQTISAKMPTKRILVVFPHNLRAGSFIEFADARTGRTERIEPI